MIARAISGVVWLGGVASALSILAITGIMTYEVVARYVFSRPTYWALEIVSYLLVATAALGMGYVMQSNGHVAVDVVERRLPRLGRAITYRLTLLIAAVFALVLVWAGIDQTRHAYKLGEVSLTPLAMRMWIPIALVPIGGALLLLQALLMLLSRRPNPDGSAGNPFDQV